MATFSTLREANLARQAEWDPGAKISLSFRGNELAGEVGEACNVIKKLERERLGIQGSRDTVEHLGQELADVVICADLIAMAEGIDLDAAVADKFNRTSFRVGLETYLAPPVTEIGDPIYLTGLRRGIAVAAAYVGGRATMARELGRTGEASDLEALRQGILRMDRPEGGAA